ncbi:MAG: hypothetical protein K5683_02875 [Prevotella sp.]|nr:hypothetical protein [Prevotella sp.]
MSQVCIYLKLKPFVAQYLHHHFGDPVRFEPQSVLNARIVAVLQSKRGHEPEVATEGMTAVCIPYSKQKDPANWNYVSQNGKRFIIELIDALFLNNLWSEMYEMVGDEKRIQSAAYAWCEMHGIDIEHADTIRMKFYRERIKLLKRGIDLRKKTRIKIKK